MKQVKMLLPVIASGIVLIYTSCKKDTTYEVSPTVAAVTAANDPVPAPNSAPYSLEVNMQPATSDPNGIVQWQAGTITTANVAFDATNMGTSGHVNYMVPTVQYDLFAFSRVGGINVPTGMYNGIAMKFRLEPRGSNMALFLNGRYNRTGASIPVQVMVSQPVELSAPWGNAFKFAANQTYPAMLNINLDQIMMGITDDMIKGGLIKNGMLTISRDYNPALYNKVLANLPNAMRVQFPY